MRVQSFSPTLDLTSGGQGAEGAPFKELHSDSSHALTSVLPLSLLVYYSRYHWWPALYSFIPSPTWAAAIDTSGTLPVPAPVSFCFSDKKKLLVSWELAWLCRYNPHLHSIYISVGSCWPAGDGIWWMNKCPRLLVPQWEDSEGSYSISLRIPNKL